MNLLDELLKNPGTRARNPHLVGLGKLPATIGKRDPRKTLDGEQCGPKESLGRVEKRSGPFYRCTIISFRRRLITDDDNLRGGCKHLRDAISSWLGRDDNDREILWAYGQHRTDGLEGVQVLIEEL